MRYGFFENRVCEVVWKVFIIQLLKLKVNMFVNYYNLRIEVYFFLIEEK